MNWIFIISMVFALVGFWLFVYEVIQGNVHRATKWSQLKENQWTSIIMSLSGVIGLILIAASIIIKKAFA